MIDANKVLQDQLARSLGLDRYEEIMQGDPQSSDFQRFFNGYYRIRRNEDLCKPRYAAFRSEGGKPVQPPCQQLVSICLMPHVPYYLVLGRVKYTVDSHGKLHCAEI